MKDTRDLIIQKLKVKYSILFKNTFSIISKECREELNQIEFKLADLEQQLAEAEKKALESEKKEKPNTTILKNVFLAGFKASESG